MTDMLPRLSELPKLRAALRARMRRELCTASDVMWAVWRVVVGAYLVAAFPWATYRCREIECVEQAGWTYCGTVWRVLMDCVLPMSVGFGTFERLVAMLTGWPSTAVEFLWKSTAGVHWTLAATLLTCAYAWSRARGLQQFWAEVTTEAVLPPGVWPKRAAGQQRVEAPESPADTPECAVCCRGFDEVKRVVLWPCGHAGYCAECVCKFKRCPACKADVDGFLRIFL